jgi:hypothetical protein
MLQKTFADRAVMGGRHSVDEAMIAGKVNKAVLVVHVQGKPTPDGFKVWCLCDSATGYVHRFVICDGTEQSYYS